MNAEILNKRRKELYRKKKTMDIYRSKDIVVEHARVSCCGNNMWMDHHGNPISGRNNAHNYAVKINDLLIRTGAV